MPSTSDFLCFFFFFITYLHPSDNSTTQQHTHSTCLAPVVFIIHYMAPMLLMHWPLSRPHDWLVVSSTSDFFLFLFLLYLPSSFRQLNHIKAYPFNVPRTCHVHRPLNDRHAPDALAFVPSTSDLFLLSSFTFILQTTQQHNNISIQRAWHLSCSPCIT